MFVAMDVDATQLNHSCKCFAHRAQPKMACFTENRCLLLSFFSLDAIEHLKVINLALLGFIFINRLFGCVDV